MREGFSVARNTPYAGGHTTALYGRVASGCHALQIEINRALYLDEDRIAKKAGIRNRPRPADAGDADTDGDSLLPFSAAREPLPEAAE